MTVLGFSYSVISALSFRSGTRGLGHHKYEMYLHLRQARLSSAIPYSEESERNVLILRGGLLAPRYRINASLGFVRIPSLLGANFSKRHPCPGNYRRRSAPEQTLPTIGSDKHCRTARVSQTPLVRLPQIAGQNQGSEPRERFAIEQRPSVPRDCWIPRYRR
jgi:hypothetical protein